MKKGFVVLFSVVFMVLLISACGRSDTPEAGDNPDITPSETVQEPLTALQEIEAANTPEELRALIETYQAGGDFGSMYLATRKLIKLDPSDAQAYRDAIAALLGTISGDYQEIENLIALGIQNAPDSAGDFVHWAAAQNQTFSFTVPFVSDYASESEINTVGSTPANITNEDALNSEFWQSGLLTTQGDWVYFMLPGADYYVYKMRKDGTGFTNVGDARGDNLNVVGDWLYYKNLNDHGQPYRIRTDGTQKEGPLFNKAVMMSVTKDWIYYNDMTLFKARTDGSEITPLSSDPCELMSVFDGWIYYCTGGNNSEFRRISVEGGEPQKLTDGWLYEYSIEDGWVYYIPHSDQKAVWRMRTDGSEQGELFRHDYLIHTFAVAAGKLAISTGPDVDERGKPRATELIVIDLATNTVQQTLQASVYSIYTAGDTIYYLDENHIWQTLNLSTGAGEMIEAPASATQNAPEQAAEQTAPGVTGNTAANLFMRLDEAGAGLVAWDGERLYFGNPNDGYRLYAAAQNGDANARKLLDTGVSYVNIVGDTVYYCDAKDGNSVCSIGADGQGRKKLANGPCDDLSYADGFLYYRMSKVIYRLPASGGESFALVYEKTRNVYAADGWVYYIEDHEAGGLWRVPVDGGDPQPLLTDHPAKFYALQGNLIYCTVDAGESMEVRRMNLDGTDQSVVYSMQEKLDAINVSGNRLLILKNASDGVHKMILVWNLDQNLAEATIEGLAFSAAWCFDSDVYYITDGGLVRQNLDSGERISIKQ